MLFRVTWSQLRKDFSSSLLSSTRRAEALGRQGGVVRCHGALETAVLGAVCVHWPCHCTAGDSAFPRGCSWRPRRPALGQQTLSAQGIRELVMGSSAHSGRWAGGQRPICRQEIEAKRPVAGQGPEAGGWRLEAGAGSVSCSLLQVHYPTRLWGVSECPHLTAAFRTSRHGSQRLRVCRPDWPWGNFRGLSGGERRSVQTPGLEESP